MCRRPQLRRPIPEIRPLRRPASGRQQKTPHRLFKDDVTALKRLVLQFILRHVSGLLMLGQGAGPGAARWLRADHHREVGKRPRDRPLFARNLINYWQRAK